VNNFLLRIINHKVIIENKSMLDVDEIMGFDKRKCINEEKDVLIGWSVYEELERKIIPNAKESPVLLENITKRWEKTFFSDDCGHMQISNVCSENNLIFISKEKSFRELDVYAILPSIDIVEKRVEVKGAFTAQLKYCTINRLYFDLEIDMQSGENHILLCTDLEFKPIWGEYLGECSWGIFGDLKLGTIMEGKNGYLLLSTLSKVQEKLSWEELKKNLLDNKISSKHSRKVYLIQNDAVIWCREIAQSYDVLYWFIMEENSFYYVTSSSIKEYSYTGELLYSKELSIQIEFFDQLEGVYRAIIKKEIGSERRAYGFENVFDSEYFLVKFDNARFENYSIERKFLYPICNWLGNHNGIDYWFERLPEGGSGFKSSNSSDFLITFDTIFSSTYDFISLFVNKDVFYIVWNKSFDNQGVWRNSKILTVDLEGKIIQKIEFCKKNEFIEAIQISQNKLYVYSVSELPLKEPCSIYDDVYQRFVRCFNG